MDLDCFVGLCYKVLRDINVSNALLLGGLVVKIHIYYAPSFHVLIAQLTASAFSVFRVLFWQ